MSVKRFFRAMKSFFSAISPARSKDPAFVVHCEIKPLGNLASVGFSENLFQMQSVNTPMDATSPQNVGELRVYFSLGPFVTEVDYVEVEAVYVARKGLIQHVEGGGRPKLEGKYRYIPIPIFADPSPLVPCACQGWISTVRLAEGTLWVNENAGKDEALCREIIHDVLESA